MNNVRRKTHTYVLVQKNGQFNNFCRGTKLHCEVYFLSKLAIYITAGIKLTTKKDGKVILLDVTTFLLLTFKFTSLENLNHHQVTNTSIKSLDVKMHDARLPQQKMKKKN